MSTAVIYDSQQVSLPHSSYSADVGHIPHPYMQAYDPRRNSRTQYGSFFLDATQAGLDSHMSPSRPRSPSGPIAINGIRQPTTPPPGSLASNGSHSWAANTSGPGQPLNSRSARMRRALSVPVRLPSPPVIATQQSPPNGFFDDYPSPFQQSLLRGSNEVIAEFAPRDQSTLHPLSPSNPSFIDSIGSPPAASRTPLPPRLQSAQPQPQTRSWRTSDQGLPPRFRNAQRAPVPRIPSPPPFTWNQPFHLYSPQQDHPIDNLAISFHHQLSQPQHLSAFLSNNVSYSPGIPSDTRSKAAHTPVNVPSKAVPLAPIGAERAQRLASTVNIIPSNQCSRLPLKPISVGSPPGLSKPRLDSASLRRASLQLGQNINLSPPVNPSVSHGPSQLEKLYNRMKLSKQAPRIFSPLSPLRNSDSWALSDGKWRREERELRAQRIFNCCDNSVHRRKIMDIRSRAECEEYLCGLEPSDHCFRCRQDTLRVRVLVERAREFTRSTSTSPTSSSSSSDEDGILDDDSLLATPVDSPVLSASLGKPFEMVRVEVVDADDVGNDGSIAATSSSVASHIHA